LFDTSCFHAKPIRCDENLLFIAVVVAIYGSLNLVAHPPNPFIMKLLFALSVVVSASAFAPGMFAVRGKTSLQSSVRPDTSKWIAEALAAGEKYGPASPEARLAWEAVEEMDSADNR
jgi:hypothetical protein